MHASTQNELGAPECWKELFRTMLPLLASNTQEHSRVDGWRSQRTHWWRGGRGSGGRGVWTPGGTRTGSGGCTPHTLPSTDACTLSRDVCRRSMTGRHIEREMEGRVWDLHTEMWEGLVVSGVCIVVEHLDQEPRVRRVRGSENLKAAFAWHCPRVKVGVRGREGTALTGLSGAFSWKSWMATGISSSRRLRKNSASGEHIWHQNGYTH